MRQILPIQTLLSCAVTANASSALWSCWLSRIQYEGNRLRGGGGGGGDEERNLFGPRELEATSTGKRSQGPGEVGGGAGKEGGGDSGR